MAIDKRTSPIDKDEILAVLATHKRMLELDMGATEDLRMVPLVKSILKLGEGKNIKGNEAERLSRLETLPAHSKIVYSGEIGSEHFNFFGNIARAVDSFHNYVHSPQTAGKIMTGLGKFDDEEVERATKANLDLTRVLIRAYEDYAFRDGTRGEIPNAQVVAWIADTLATHIGLSYRGMREEIRGMMTGAKATLSAYITLKERYSGEGYENYEVRLGSVEEDMMGVDLVVFKREGKVNIPKIYVQVKTDQIAIEPIYYDSDTSIDLTGQLNAGDEETYGRLVHLSERDDVDWEWIYIYPDYFAQTRVK